MSFRRNLLKNCCDSRADSSGMTLWEMKNLYFFQLMSIKTRIFEKIHTGNLVYNTCWEDPRCDRELLDLDEKSRVVMLTSAGCNALDYLLDRPASVDCVDMNPRQNALLDLKLALFSGSDHETLFRFFGDGQHQKPREVFQEIARPFLPDFSKNYWEKHISAFDGMGFRQSFYYFGSSGTVAFWLKKFLAADPETDRSIRKMFEAEDLQRQRMNYYRVEPKLLGRFVAWLLNRHFVQSMLGVPRSQQEMARQSFTDGMTGYFRHCFRKVFVEQTLSDNYFWKLYFFGKYDAACCPNYLKKEHFKNLQKNVARVQTHTATMSNFLKKRPGKYTHFVLLDHQDWLAANDRPALDEEWDLIFKNSAPGAKVLFRSAAFDRSFLPSFVQQKVKFDDEKVKNGHRTDRVGTYASVHFGLVSNT